MILTDTTILERMNADFPTVQIQPFDMRRLGTNSYDVSLAGDFYAVHWESGYPVFYGPLSLQKGRSIFLPSGWTVLGRTVEIVGSRKDIVIELRAKSSTRRLGVSAVADAGLGDVSYWGQFWTVELVALIPSGQKVRMTIGEAFAQAVFWQATEPSFQEYNGQYTTAVPWPLCMIPKRFRGEEFGDEFIRPMPPEMIDILTQP